MKKYVLVLLSVFICNFVFAETKFIFSNGSKIEFKYDENTPDIWMYAGNDKTRDSYLIESLGPDCRIDSVFTDVVNGKNVFFVKVYLGNPGGRQKLDVRNLYVFEVTKDCKIELFLNKELVNIHYSVASDSFVSNKVYFYTYNSETKEISIFTTDNYNFTEIEKIKLKELIR